MSRYIPNSTNQHLLKDKVVVLSGGANGIGASTVRIFLSLSCKVVFGDVNEKAAQKLVQELTASDSSVTQRLKYVRTDVSVYEDIYKLFSTAFELFGRVDIAVNIAGLGEIGNWFDADVTISTAKEVENKKPTTVVMEVNALGSLYFSRIATVFLRENQQAGEDKSLILTSSLAGFKQTPGLFVYQASKHAVLGLMRSLRIYPPVASHIRVNAICPWMTLTQMVVGMQDTWLAAGLPVNDPSDIAGIIAGIATDPELRGESIYIEGGRGWKVEKGLNETEKLWLGEKQSADLAKAEIAMGTGLDWTNREGGKE